MTNTWKALEEYNHLSMQLKGSELDGRDQISLPATCLPFRCWERLMDIVIEVNFFLRAQEA